jgi:adenylylsulfate kinase-like enzyme
MRLIMTGRSGSGKTTALHHLLSHGLRHRWSEILILDGKQSSLAQYAGLPPVSLPNWREGPGWGLA